MTTLIDEAQYERAISAGRAALSQPYATEASYDKAKQILSISWSTGAVLSFKPQDVEALRHLSPEELSLAYVTPGGDGLIFGNELGSFDLSMQGLLEQLVPCGQPSVNS